MIKDISSEDFCVRLAELKLNHVDKAVSILWFHDQRREGTAKTSGELSRAMRDSGIGEPHSTKLGKSLEASKHTLSKSNNFRIKPTSRQQVKNWLSPILETPEYQMDHKSGYLPEDVWTGTITYVGKLAKQLNTCFKVGCHDAAAVMIRRVVETLLIEAYEAKGIDHHIRDNTSNNYFMLKRILDDAINHDQQRLKLSRDTKAILRKIKEAGDRSAHNRRYIAVEADLKNIRSGVRLAVDELLHIAEKK